MTLNVEKSKYCILIRDAENLYGEKEIMRELGIPFVEYRSEVPEDSLVIGRYSVIPFYQELEKDLQSKNSHLINTYNQFRFCADLGNWYQALEEFTPKTWFSLQDYLASSYEGPVVLKGETNSRRDKWKTHMFAENKEQAREVYFRLTDDGLVGQQKIYIRKYEKLKKLIDGVNGMPIPNEWRVFYLYSQPITCHYYWSSYLEDIRELGIEPERPPIEAIKRVRYRVHQNSNFYSADLAQREDGSWMVVELNEGQMSGLNSCPPLEFYRSIKEIIHVK